MDIAIIGLGGVGRLHLAAARGIEGVRITGLCDLVAADLDQLAAGAGATPFRRLEDLLASKTPGLAVIATPAATHAPLVRLCASAGVHVLCEKPLAITMDEARGMVAACDAAGVRLIYGASYRYIPALVEARCLIGAGAIGAVAIVRETLIGGIGRGGHVPMGPGHYPAGGPGGSGFGLVDHGIHLIDLLPWLTGSPIRRVMGRGNRAGEEPRPEYLVAELDNGAVGLLTYFDDTFGTELPSEGVFGLGAGWGLDGRPVAAYGWQAAPQAIHIHGAQGALRVLHYAHALYLTDAAGTRQMPIAGEPPPAQFAAQLQAAIDAVAGVRHDVPTGADGVRALGTLLEIYDDHGPAAGPRIDR